MKLPHQLTREELIRVVSKIRDWLYMGQDELAVIEGKAGNPFARDVAAQASKDENMEGLFDYLDPDKEWDAETLDGICDVLKCADLVPDRCMTPSEAYRAPTPNENWANDEIQFARLLEELQGVGVVDLLKEAEWQALEASMDLDREKIMELFGRAQRAWGTAKANLPDLQGLLRTPAASEEIIPKDLKAFLDDNDEALDDAVHDEQGLQASGINNGGYEDQIAFLRANGWSWDDIRAAAGMAEASSYLNKAMGEVSSAAQSGQISEKQAESLKKAIEAAARGEDPYQHYTEEA